MPTLTIVGGANGAGKSTITRFARELFQTHPVLDPDAVARLTEVAALNNPSAIDAGRTVLQMAEAFLGRCESFLVETTLSGHTYLRMMRRAKLLGYEITLLYVGTESIEINIERIRERVRRGGHDVPEADQRRRYPRSFNNMKKALELADEAILFDNSSIEGPRKVALKDERGISFYPPLPKWVVRLQI